MLHSIICLILQILTICETPCGEVSFENTSNAAQTVNVVSTTGSPLSSFTISAYSTETKTLSKGSYTLNVVPAGVNYKLRVEGCVSEGDPTPEVSPTDFLFSVSPSQKVRFSPGNLQYQASTDTWRFAEHQYDYVGDDTTGNVSEEGNQCDNTQISSTYSGWIDLFGWGTSGYNGKMPYMTSTAFADYGDGNNAIAETNYDWGVFNSISNGSIHQWRTLTTEEWEYMIKTRGNTFYGHATVCGVKGFVLLPDNWQLPAGQTFVPNTHNYETNTYSTAEWEQMEINGAVFLPAAGIRDGNIYINPYETGYYWTSSTYSNTQAMQIFFTYFDFYTGNTGMIDSNKHLRYQGLAVRLVRDL